MNLIGQHGEFGVYDDYGPSSAFVKVNSIVNVKAIADTTAKLLALQLAVSDVEKSNTYSIKCRVIRLKNTKCKSMEISAGVWINSTGKPQGWHAVKEVLNWLKANHNLDQVPALTDIKFDTSKLSVGPCSYPATDGAKFVKVRFDGVSIPVYFNDEKILLDRTKEALLPDNGPHLAQNMLGIVSNHSATILERAKERPLNISGISEYAHHEISYWVETLDHPVPNVARPPTRETIGWPLAYDYGSDKKPVFYHKVDAGSPLLSNPDMKVYPLCSYGYDWRGKRSYAYVLIDDVFYNVSGFHHMHYQYNQYSTDGKEQKFNPNTFNSSNYGREPSIHISVNSFFVASALTLVAADDTFVRSKALRTLKAKL